MDSLQTVVGRWLQYVEGKEQAVNIFFAKEKLYIYIYKYTLYTVYMRILKSVKDFSAIWCTELTKKDIQKWWTWKLWELVTEDETIQR